MISRGDKGKIIVAKMIKGLQLFGCFPQMAKQLRAKLSNASFVPYCFAPNSFAFDMYLNRYESFLVIRIVSECTASVLLTVLAHGGTEVLPPGEKLGQNLRYTHGG